MKRFRYLCVLILLGMIFESVPGAVLAADSSVTYYVRTTGDDSRAGTTSRGAFKTLKRAREAIIESIGKSDVVINIDEGTYILDEAFTLTASDLQNSPNTVTFKPITEGEEVIISGGRSVSGFELYEGNIYRAPYTHDLRQLYVNGTPAIRARSTDDMGIEILTNTVTDEETGTDTTTPYAFKAPDKSIADWKNLNNVELVFKQSFVSNRKCIKKVEVEEENAIIYVNYIHELSGSYSLLGEYSALLYVENAYELLDEGGEWYHDGEYIYYMPREGEVIDEVIASDIEKPIEVIGDAQNPVSNITFKGITFSHAGWLYPTKKKQLISSQNNIIAADDGQLVCGIVNIKYANNIVFDGCTFKNSGANGLNIMDGSKNVTVTGCEFENLASCGMQIGRVNGEGNVTLPENDADVIENITVEHSTIHDCATEYYAASALAMGFVKNSRFVHNEIYNMPYAGIHTGWGWSYRPNSITQGIEIKYNYLHDCMQMLKDGGIIYTLGGTNVQSGIMGNYNEISYNYIEDTHSAGGAIYNDNGSSYWSVHHNVINCKNTTDYSWINIAPDTNDILNQFNYVNTSITKSNRTEDALLSDMMKNNILYSMNENTVPTINGYMVWTANNIIKNAGTQKDSLVEFAAFSDGAEMENVMVYNRDMVIKDGGYIKSDKPMLKKTLDFNVFLKDGRNETGSYEIDIDGVYKIKVTSENITLSGGGYEDLTVSSATWSQSASGDVSITLDENSITFSTGNIRKIGASRPVSKGIIKISATGTDMAIGALSKHISFYKDRMESDRSAERSIAQNGYFEEGVGGWTAYAAAISHSTDNTFNNTLGGIKITEQLHGGYAYTEAQLEAGEWYRVSAMIKTQNSENAVVKFNHNKDTDWGIGYSMKDGWNYICDYIKAEENGTYRIYPTINNPADTWYQTTQYTYYMDNFEIVKESPRLTEGGFENGIGAWTGYGILEKATENGYTGKALTVDTTSYQYTYYHPWREIYLKPGKKYKVRAKLLTQAVSADKVEVYISVDNDSGNVNITDQTAYAGGRAVLGEWQDVEFTFTWKSEEINEYSPAYLKVLIKAGMARVYVDDLELYEISGYNVRNDNPYFLNGLSGWEYEGDVKKSEDGEGISIEAGKGKLYQDVSVTNGTRYYAECIVESLSEQEIPKAASIVLAPQNSDIEDVSVNGDFIKENGVIRSRIKVIEPMSTVSLGGFLTLSKETPDNIRVRMSYESEEGEFRIKSFRLIPASDLAAEITSAQILDGALTYTPSDGKLRYRIFCYDNGMKEQKSGLAENGSISELPPGERYMAELTAIGKNGADEMTLITESAHIAALLCDENSECRAFAKKPDSARLITAVYKDGVLLGISMTEDEYLNHTIPQEERDGIEVKAFVWDNELFKPLCEDKIYTVNG